GQHQMWGAQFVGYQRPNQWMNSAGLGTMGFAIPAAMGAQVAEPDRAVWAIDGDGCFQMTNQELATCVINQIPIKIALINNSSLGMVRQWQTLFYDSRYSNTDLNTGANSIRVPDFVKLAEAYGAVGIRVEEEADVAPAIERAMEINDRPVLDDFVVSADSMVWPMVPSGVASDENQVARYMTPDGEGDAEHATSNPFGTGPRRAGCPRPSRRTLRPSGIQHRIIDRGSIGSRGPLAHDRRGRSRGRRLRAGHQTAQ